jgi:hypothetical protein
MNRYFKLAYYYLKLRLVVRLRKRFLIKVLHREAPLLASTLSKAGLSVKAWIQDVRQNPSLYTHPAETSLLTLKNQAPQFVTATVAAADKVVAHEFDMLGSGPFKPVDPDRKTSPDGYEPIDWYLDPVAGLRFPQGIICTDWDLFKMRPGLADIKLPWELARCQHWPVLGQAYQLTHDEKYAIEMARQLDDFTEVNPVGIGIHWTCTMDVALRASSWAIGLELIRHAKSLDEDFWLRAYDALYVHGLFIRHNLENISEVSTNHFLSNLVGLFYVSAIFHALPEGREWRQFCREHLEHEMQNQVLEDGADFESSIPYHRLAVELFLGAARLADVSGEPLSKAYRQRLNSMLDYMLGVLRPDGLMPQCGDADDGRLHIFTHYGNWTPQDPRHVFAPAACILERPDLLKHAGTDGLWEAAWWGLDTDGLNISENSLPPVSQLFSDAGHAVYRNNGTYLIVTNSVVGTNGLGNHKHNDQLGFEFHAQGVPLLVDPGSYVYTSDPYARNMFRGTGYHNTIKIDGTEQNDMNPAWFFRMFDSGTPEHVSFADNGNTVEYHGRHIGYQRLNPPVVHERRFRLLKDENVLLIADIVKGEGQHTLEWHFHCAPGLQISDEGAGRVHLAGDHQTYGLISFERLLSTLHEAWYSPSYGKKLRCTAVDFRAVTSLNGASFWGFAVAPADWLERPESKQTMDRFLAEISEL